MQCVAHYEIKAEASVFKDNHWLKFQHPRGLFRARIRNIVRKDFSTPFLLTLHLTFDAPNLQDAKEVAEERLVDCLNMLVLTTASRFSKHRTRQIVDCSAPEKDGMRNLLMWGDSIDHEDPTPFLDDKTEKTLERLLAFDPPPVLRRAMRWYRIGVNSTIPDDQFQYFWFALELIAIARKPSDKVPDECPHCHSPLYCEKCKTHPVHRPYEKQAIRALITAVDKNCDDAKLQMLENARNTLMHGGTLREIEEKLPEPREEIVDVLGRIVFLALINQFPPEVFKERITFGNPSTYVYRTLSGIAHMQMPVPLDAEGEFDLSFTGTKMQMIADGPPQSARPALIVMTPDQYKRLEKLAYRKGDHQEMCQRICKRSEKHEDNIVGWVISSDLDRIEEALRKGEKGEWQDLFREIKGDAPEGGGAPAPRNAAERP